METYLSHAIFDTVTMKSGRVKVVHSYRDLDFEAELKRNGISIASKMSESRMPFRKKVKQSDYGLELLHFKDSLKVVVDGKSMEIEHGETLSIVGDALTTLKVSNSSDIIVRTSAEISNKRFKAELESAPKDTPKEATVPKEEKETPPKKPKEKPRRQKGVFVNEPTPSQKEKPAAEPLPAPDPAPKPQPAQPEPKPQPKPIGKRGFDIDTSF